VIQPEPSFEIGRFAVLTSILLQKYVFFKFLILMPNVCKGITNKKVIIDLEK
jgi:hypothetical protein